jgi:hypothetical protein
MKMRFVMAAIAASALSAGSAHAGMIAGWDFSQYLGAGVLSTDGATGANTLDANYSNLDPTFGAGAESAQYGTMYIDGQFGSTNVDPFGAVQEFLPTSDSLVSNLNAGVPGGGQPFDSASTLISEGQAFANVLSMTAPGAASVVFEADLGGRPLQATDWLMTLGGKTFSGVAVVNVQISIDGVNYASAGNISLDTNDKPFTVSFAGVTASTIYAKLIFAAGAGQAIIDNVAISATTTPVPEPASFVLLGVGLAFAGALRRRSV